MISEEFFAPGELIAALMAQRGWNNRILAAVLEMDEGGVSRLIGGRRSVDAKLAIKLEELFGQPAERFLDLQRNYDLAQARAASKSNPERQARAHLYGELPVSEMIKRGWINAESVRDVGTVQSELTRFFGVNRVEDIEGMPHAAKRTNVSTEPSLTQMAWLYRVKQIASQMLVAKYSQASVASAIGELKTLLFSAEEIRKVPRVLAESGIRFLIVEALPSSKIDGVCYWLSDTAPVIALSLRFDRIDNFWFVLRHEMEHVARRHGLSKMMLDTDVEGEKVGAVQDEERLADEAAADFCVPERMMDAFIARKAPIFAEADILAFAKMQRVHPGLIAGQLRRRTGRYDRFTNHLVKIRRIIVPNAITDGWGDVAPLGL